MTLVPSLLLVPAALAGAIVEIGGLGGIVLGDGTPASGGIDLGVGASISPRWDVGAALASGATSDGSPWARTGAQVRALAAPAEDRRLRPYLVAGAGIGVTDPLRPAFWVGPGVQAGKVGAVGWRLEARLVNRRPTTAWRAAETRVEIGLGLHLRARPRSRPPAVISVPPESRVWLPHPWCAWVPADQLPSLLAALPDKSEIVVTAEGRVPVVVEVNAGTSVEVQLDEAPHQGALVVVANPADTVRIGDLDLQLAEDGILLANLPEGPITLEVTGGGRLLRQELAVAEGWATWLRIPPPEPQAVFFPLDSSILDAAGHARVAELAARRGQWRFLLEGSWSTEGQETRNTLLGQLRAEAVREALLAAGVPVEAVVVGAPAPPPVGPPLPEQRVCRIVALPPEST